MPYFDLSLQHASGRLLRRMRRWGDGDRFLRRIDAIRAREPDAAFRSSFIVGYPGETEADHDELLGLRGPGASSTGPGSSPTAPRTAPTPPASTAGSPASWWPSAWPSCATCQDGITARRRDALIGSVVEVLVDAPGVARGHREAPEIDGIVAVPRDLPVGELVKVRIDGAAGPDLEASRA